MLTEIVNTLVLLLNAISAVVNLTTALIALVAPPKRNRRAKHALRRGRHKK